MAVPDPQNIVVGRAGSAPGVTRVVLVFDNLELSGADKVAINLLRNAGAMGGIELSGVICMDDTVGHARVSPLLRHLTPGPPAGNLAAARVKKAYTALAELRRVAKQAEVLIPVTPPAALLCAIAAWRCGCKVVPWVHYDFVGIMRDRWPAGRRIRGLFHRILHRWFIPRFRRLIFVSETCRRSFPNAPRRSRDWVTLPNVFDPESFVSSADSGTVGRLKALKRRGFRVFGFVGRIFRQKRWEDAIRVAEVLLERGFGFELVFIGDGIELDSFLAAIARSPAKAVLHYLGPDANAQESLRMLDGLLLTSLFEAWPTVILEAFASDVPVFAYDCPSGPREMLGNGTRGSLSTERPELLANGIIEYFGKDDESRRIQAVLAHEFVDSYRPDNVTAKWERHLLEMGPRATTRGPADTPLL